MCEYCLCPYKDWSKYLTSFLILLPSVRCIKIACRLFIYVNDLNIDFFKYIHSTQKTANVPLAYIICQTSLTRLAHTKDKWLSYHFQGIYYFTTFYFPLINFDLISALVFRIEKRSNTRKVWLKTRFWSKKMRIYCVKKKLNRNSFSNKSIRNSFDWLWSLILEQF